LDSLPGSNITTSRKGKVLITDFGIALAKGEVIITQPDDCTGSLHYISPEQVAGRDEEVDERSAVDSLGV